MIGIRGGIEKIREGGWVNVFNCRSIVVDRERELIFDGEGLLRMIERVLRIGRAMIESGERLGHARR
jgi:hypothetical protein